MNKKKYEEIIEFLQDILYYFDDFVQWVGPHPEEFEEMKEDFKEEIAKL